MKHSYIPWHPAFIAAVQMELEDYKDSLEFHSEFQLTTEPLKIDCVIIKKAKNVIINKNFASIFRDVNLLEYKNPDDYISVDDFYKVYAYACLYASFEKTPMTRMTISFIQSRKPRKLINHLEKIRGYTVDKASFGIYTVKGDILPIQIVDNRQLTAEDNLWLKGLSKRLDPNMMVRLGDAIGRYDKDAKINAYFDAVTRANFKAIEEARKMSS